jgi:hypothetical protein
LKKDKELIKDTKWFWVISKMKIRSIYYFNIFKGNIVFWNKLITYNSNNINSIEKYSYNQKLQMKYNLYLNFLYIMKGLMCYQWNIMLLDDNSKDYKVEKIDFL